MGTRGLIGIQQDGVFHGMYNHFDSYPDGLGQDVVDFVKMHLDTPEKVLDFREKCRNVTWVNEETEAPKELQERYKEAGFSDTGVSSGKLSEWYVLLREVQGARTFVEIASGKLQHVVPSADLGSFYYEYVLNLDEGTVEFYSKGKLKGAKTFADTEGWESFYKEEGE